MTLLARRMPSMVLCPVPYLLSNIILVEVSLTATMGYLRAPSFSMALSLCTPVVVCSLPPLMSGMSSGRFLWTLLTRSQPSSMVS